MTRYFMSLPGRQSIIFLPGVRHIYIHYYDTTSPTIKALSLILEGKAVIKEKLCLFVPMWPFLYFLAETTQILDPIFNFWKF